MTDSWSKIEVDFIVADYFDMLINELNRIPYTKADHRRRLLPLLKNRSEGSVEFKYQNISAVLINHGKLYIIGYLPRYNYQNLLEDVVIQYLADHSELDTLFQNFSERLVTKPEIRPEFEKIIVAPPMIVSVKEPKGIYQRKLIKTNYIEKEQANRTLGLYGEELVVEFEKWNLIRSGKNSLADKIEWISKVEGDGAGFDILSKNLNGTDKYIEVKTTRLGKETPFFFSANELQFSTIKAHDYHLYRIFNADNDVKMFQKNGALNFICQSTPTMYKGYF
jgi:hypothetical protein